MAIQSRKNQYRGVNAHLHRLLQTVGTPADAASWSSLHNLYIAYLTEALNRQLPRGYIAINERSLQIQGRDDHGRLLRKWPEPDVSIHQTISGSIPMGSEFATAPTWEAIRDETWSDESPLDAILIYQQTEQKHWGKAVTRIEVLSPSNKPGGSNDVDYLKKRRLFLLSGTPLLEIDYLHESSSPISDFPRYPHEHNSYPYSIVISDPRPDPKQVQDFRSSSPPARLSRSQPSPLHGRGGEILKRPSITGVRSESPKVHVKAYGLSVDTVFPPVALPLMGEDYLIFDFGHAYQRAYEAGHWYILVDYAALPERFDTYSSADQERIRRRMGAIKMALDEGKDLEQGPFEI